MHPTVYMSNRLEELFEELQAKILQKKPLSKVHILVSDRTIKSWLYRRLCKKSETGSIFGVEICHITENHRSETALAKDLLFKSEQFLKRVLEDQKILDDLSFEERNDIVNLLQKSSKKGFLHLVQEFFHLVFMKTFYSIEPTVQKFTANRCLVDLVPLFLKEISKDKIVQKIDGDVHFFGIVALGKNFIQLQENFTSAYFYVLSPCMMFWSDICSDREAFRYTKLFSQQNSSHSGQLTFDSILFDRNPLLANCGQLGRDFTTTLEDDSFQYVEKYVALDFAKELFSQDIRLDALTCRNSPKSAITTLGIIQTSLLLLQGPQENKVALQKDKSFRMYCSESILEEVEALYDEVSMFSRDVQEVLEPASILVLSPFIERYLPYIERIFSVKHANYDYEILSSKREQELYKIYLDFFLLEEKRWSKQSLIRILECSAVLKKLKLIGSDLGVIIEAFETLGFSFGMSDEHCSDILLKEGLIAHKDISWQSFSKIESNFFDQFMKQESHLDISTSELLCSVFSYFTSLYHDLSNLEKSLKTPAMWAKEFETLRDKYLEFGSEMHREKIGFDEAFKTLSTIENPHAVKIDLESSLFHLKAAFKYVETNAYAFCQKPIVFAKIEEMHAHPCKMLCFLGLDDDAFTGAFLEKEREYGYLFSQNQNRGFASVQKYCFISALCGVQNRLYISYQGYTGKAREKREPHDVVLDLLRSLDLVATIDDMMPTVAYFLEQKRVFEKESAQSFSQQWSFQKIEVQKQESCIEIEKLRAHAKNPLKTYFQNSLKLIAPAKLQDEFHDSMLDMSSWQFYQKCQDLIHEKPFEKARVAPCGIMNKVSSIRLFEKKQLFDEMRKKLKIENKPWVLEFSSQCQEIMPKFGDVVLCPPLSLECKDKTIFLVGRIEGCVDDGLLVHAKKSKQSIYKMWADLLIFASIQKELYGKDECFLYFLLDGSSEKFNFKDPKNALVQFVAYYYDSCEYPSGLYPDSIDKLLDPEFSHTQWHNAQKSSFYPIDPHVEMLLQGISQDVLKELWNAWKMTAKLVYLESTHEF